MTICDWRSHSSLSESTPGLLRKRLGSVDTVVFASLGSDPARATRELEPQNTIVIDPFAENSSEGLAVCAQDAARSAIVAEHVDGTGWEIGQGVPKGARIDMVETGRIDKLVAPEDIAAPAILYVDVSGGEAAALSGAAGVIMRFDAVIVRTRPRLAGLARRQMSSLLAASRALRLRLYDVRADPLAADRSAPATEILLLPGHSALFEHTGW